VQDPDRQALRQSAWRQMALAQGFAARLLKPVASVYGCLVELRHRLYNRGWLTSTRLEVPVIVVGNVIVGGAGKTPTTIAVVQHLLAQGWRPGVVSRGYGREDQAIRAVDKLATAAQVGDEPLLISQATGVPVWVGRQRAAAAQALLTHHPEVNIIVCDDGLQHRALAADVRLVVFDDRGIGNGWLLPAGLLREPWPPTGAQPYPDLLLQQVSPNRAGEAVPPLPGRRVWRARRRLALHAVHSSGERRPLSHWSGGAVVALAGIARPEVFFEMLRGQGLTLQATQALADHADPQHALTTLLASGLDLLCTEKDAVKLRGASPDASIWAVPLELDTDPQFFAALDQCLNKCRRA
jgi:tetraacyldisaccharide 4'-kinase